MTVPPVPTEESVFTWGAPPLKFGAGAVDEIGFEMAQFGAKRVLILTDPAINALGIPARIAESLTKHGITSEIFDGVHVEPTDDSMDKAAGYARTQGPWDGFVAVGGGSAIDTAKAVNLLTTDEGALMVAIARRTVSDEQVMEALMPGSTSADLGHAVAPQSSAISIKGLTPGVAYDLATCCHPVPGDRIVGLRRPDAGIEVHAIDCRVLAELAERTENETDWVDVAWGEKTEGAVARISVMVKNEPGSLGVVASIIGTHMANIINLRLDTRDTSFHTNEIDVEVHDVHQLMRLMAALRAADAVNAVERA